MIARADELPDRTAKVFAHLSARAVTDRSSPIPLWAQLRGVLAEAIRSGALAPDDQIPSEQALSAMFAVSRPVVRGALAALAKEDLVVKLPRRGVFVAGEREELDFVGSNVGLFGDLTTKGHAVTTHTLKLARAAPEARQRNCLRLPLGADVVNVRRIYLIDGRAIAIGIVAVPASRAPGLERLAFENRSLYATLREHYGVVVVRSERWLDAVAVDGDQADKLELEPGTPVMRIESIGWSAEGVPVEHYEALYNTQLSRVHLEASIAPAAEGGQP